MLFNSIGCFVQSPPFTLPHFNKIEASLLYLVSSQCIELSLITATLDILLTKWWTHFSTGRKVVKATHGFKRSVAMRTRAINTKAVNFLLSACCIEAFNFTIWSCSLKKRQDKIFKAVYFVMLRCESAGCWIEIPPPLKTGQHGLTHRIDIVG